MENDVTCIECHCRLPASAKFCMECGTPVLAAPTARQQPVSSVRSGRIRKLQKVRRSKSGRPQPADQTAVSVAAEQSAPTRSASYVGVDHDRPSVAGIQQPNETGQQAFAAEATSAVDTESRAVRLQPIRQQRKSGSDKPRITDTIVGNSRSRGLYTFGVPLKNIKPGNTASEAKDLSEVSVENVSRLVKVSRNSGASARADLRSSMEAYGRPSAARHLVRVGHGNDRPAEDDVLDLSGMLARSDVLPAAAPTHDGRGNDTDYELDASAMLRGPVTPEGSHGTGGSAAGQSASSASLAGVLNGPVFVVGRSSHEFDVQAVLNNSVQNVSASGVHSRSDIPGGSSVSGSGHPRSVSGSGIRPGDSQSVIPLQPPFPAMPPAAGLGLPPVPQAPPLGHQAAWWNGQNYSPMGQTSSHSMPMLPPGTWPVPGMPGAQPGLIPGHVDSSASVPTLNAVTTAVTTTDGHEQTLQADASTTTPVPHLGLPEPEATLEAEVREESAPVVKEKAVAAREQVEVQAQPAESEKTPEISPDEAARRQRNAQAAEAFATALQSATQAVMSQAPSDETEPTVPRLLRRNIQKLEKLKPNDVEAIASCLEVIGKSGCAAAAETLKDYTGQRHLKVRVAAVRALGQSTDVRGLLVLFRLLRDPSPDVVSAAVSSLVQTRTAEAVAPLVCLATLNPATTLALQAALTELDSTEVGSFAQKLQELLRHPFPPVAAVAVRLLTKITGDAQLKTLVRLLGKHPSGEVRAAAVECLGELKRKQSVTHLNAALRDSDFRVRAAAAVAMESLHSPKSVQLLVAALRDADTTVRRNAARTLTTIDDERIAKAASEAIEDQTDSQTIEYLLEIIGQGGTEAALKTLQRYLNGEDIGFRHRAINTLKKLKNPKSVDLLIPFLADPNATTRELAVKAVGALGSRSPLPKLRELLKTDKEVKVRAATARALGELKDSKSLLALEEALHDDRMVACQAVIALGETGQKAAIPALLGQLRNPAADIRMHACGALAQIGGLERTQPLEALLNDHDPAVRRSAETALTKLGVNYRKVRLGIHVRKALVNLMPGSVSGAIPMGTVSVAAVALLVLVSAGWGLWSGLSLASGPELRVSNINAMAISHDGRQVAISRRYQVYDLWDTTTGQLRTRGATSFDALSMVFLSDSSTVLVSGGKSYRWRIEGDDPEIGPEAFSEVQSKISSGPSCVTADGRFLATATIKGQVTVTDLSTGEVFGKQVSFRDFRRDCSIAITPDGALIVAAGTNGAIQIGSTEEGSVVANVNVARVLPPEHKFSTTAVAVDSSGKFLALGSLEGEVIILDLEEGLSVVGTPAQDASRIVALRFPSEGTRLRIVTVAKGLLISEEDFSVAKSLSSRPLDVPQSVCFSADGNLAAISFSDSSAFSVIDFERDKVLVEDAGG